MPVPSPRCVKVKTPRQKATQRNQDETKGLERKKKIGEVNGEKADRAAADRCNASASSHGSMEKLSILIRSSSDQVS